MQAPEDREIKVRRGFVGIAEGQVHYRAAGLASDHPTWPTLVMLHASPGSARALEPLLRAFGASRHAIALDTLGNGDSAPPAPADPDIAYYADAHLRAMDALGLGRVDLYGAHTGATMAIEIARRQPQRLRRMVLDGVSLFEGPEQEMLIANQAPELRADLEGTQLLKVWHMVRDARLFWPWWDRRAGARRPLGLPSAESLHDGALEILKSIGTYHLSYRAALRYAKRAALREVGVPTLVACAADDMLLPYLDQVADCVPGASRTTTLGTADPEALAETCRLLTRFLGDPQVGDGC